MTASEHIKVEVDADCGNAPRKAQVRDWLIALAKGDSETVSHELDDQVRWEVAGDRVRDGIEEVRRYIELLAEDRVTQISIRHLLSHGKQVAAEGATDSRRFAHVITYTGHGKTAKIAEIISYHAQRSD